jgi:hypothetical protein
VLSTALPFRSTLGHAITHSATPHLRPTHTRSLSNSLRNLRNLQFTNTHGGNDMAMAPAWLLGTFEPLPFRLRGAPRSSRPN